MSIHYMCSVSRSQKNKLLVVDRSPPCDSNAHARGVVGHIFTSSSSSTLTISLVGPCGEMQEDLGGGGLLGFLLGTSVTRRADKWRELHEVGALFHEFVLGDGVSLTN